MIEIESIGFKNFLSYGQYLTEIPISKLGPCLITGENGFGKSSCVNAILYTLFGRTMHTAKPGNRVVNRNTGKDCLTYVKLKNGDIITRTRKMAGHNELTIEHNGNTVLSTLSTTPNQQAQLNKLYNLDWYTFRNTSFLTQIGNTWFEMPDAQRKKEIERALKIDRCTVYSQVAKSKLDKLIAEQESLNYKYDTLQQAIIAIKGDLKEAQEAEADFDINKESRAQHAIAQAREHKRQYDQIEIPDIDKLNKKWQVVEEAKKVVSSLEEKIRELKTTVSNAEYRQREAERTIILWREKAGKVCTSCKQGIPHSHSDTQIRPYIGERDIANIEIINANAEKQKLQSKINTINEIIKSEQPKMTIREVEILTVRRNQLLENANQWAKSTQDIRQEVNQYVGTIEKLNTRITGKITECDNLKIEIEHINTLIHHETYLHKSYSDRRKIKSFYIEKYTPLLNSRLRHYLDKFCLDIEIEITDTLGSTADYDFMSGGERKRVDVSFMLARFDVQEAIYGRQSNIIVFDEVDGRMDEKGIECLIDIILNDLTNKVDAILVISHRAAMRNIFPNQITIEKHGDFSILNL